MAYNLTRAAGLLAAGPFGNASVFISPKRGPGKTAWEELFTSVHAPPQAA